MIRYMPMLWVGFVLWIIGAGLKLLFSRSTSIAVYVIVVFIEGAGVGFAFQPCEFLCQRTEMPRSRQNQPSSRCKRFHRNPRWPLRHQPATGFELWAPQLELQYPLPCKMPLQHSRYHQIYQQTLRPLSETARGRIVTRQLLTMTYCRPRWMVFIPFSWYLFP